ncbi:MAG TPA: plastocyanin/azurin family copper-binding protein [bacterium]|nr:plastocyanin/azurin family copper-binding protein [bacterium]
MQHAGSSPDTSRSHGRGGQRSGRLVSLALVACLAMTAWAGAAPSPTLAAMGHAPKAYIGLFNDNAVAVLDTGTNRVLSTIPIPAGPHGLVISPDGRRVYASSDGSSTVSVISAVTDRVVSSIEVGKSPHGLAISRDGRQVLVAVFGASQVVAIDTVRNQVVARIPVGNPHNIAISPDGRTAYVAAQQPGSSALAILDLTTYQQVGTVPLAATPRALNFSPDGKALYFTLAGSAAVQVLDPTRNQIVDQIQVGESPHHPFVTATGEYGLVVVQGPGQLAVINPASRKVIGTVAVGKFPHWVGTTSDGDTAYVTNEGANTVSVVDIEKQKVLATIPVGSAPRKIVVQSGTATKADRTQIQASLAPMATAAPAQASPTPAGGAGAVKIANFAFAPAAIMVAPGTSVVWTNGDVIPHTSTGTDKQWDSKPIQPGSSFKVTFDKAGTYTYGCTIHPFMQATVVVRN